MPLLDTGQANIHSHEVNYRVLHSFARHHDGYHPFAGLLSAGTELYGTTSAGGSSDVVGGCGAVYELTTSHLESVLYSFQCAPDGEYPTDTLINLNGTLYGTTEGGGVYAKGSVFALTKSGKERVLYSFQGYNDASVPSGGLIAVNGKLYGTTARGGNYGQGTVFVVTTSGKERLVHSFGGSGDGAGPSAGLIAVKGVLYGTTGGGGANNSGTVFRVKTGREKVLYSFKGFPDGASPQSELTESAGELYGTTGSGGNYNEGAVFKVSTSGVEHVFYSFGTQHYDGQGPSSPVTVMNGTFYGLTGAGGTQQGGVLFGIAASGKEQILHNFGLASDGAYPNGRLIVVGKALLGTTQYGGKHGIGTVFALWP
ncbi:MAG: choice-of-anchor tandem repeat GloVer-containing protein [Candidatus Cybelea sp.]